MQSLEIGAMRVTGAVSSLAITGLFYCVMGWSLAPIALGQYAESGSDRSKSEQSEGTSSREAKQAAIRAIPFDQLTPDANSRLRSVIDDASYFRRLPTQTVECDPEMYTFLVRHPEVVVNIWDLMGITKVTLERVGEYQLSGNDGAGTTCKMDLVYGSDALHVYQSQGAYQGNLWARELRGRCVVMLHNRATKLPDGSPGMVAWMDAFMKLENVGAELVVKTLGPLVGKTADHNFVECAGFFSQISQTARFNPHGLQQVAMRLKNVSPSIRDEFMRTSLAVAVRANQASVDASPATPGITTSSRRVVSNREPSEQDDSDTDSPTIRRMTRSENLELPR